MSVEVPLEVDLVDGAGRHLHISAVDDPLPALVGVAGALDPDLRPRLVDGWVQCQVLVLVQAEVEALVAAFPEDHRAAIPATTFALHLLHLLVAAPGAADVELVITLEVILSLLDLHLAVPVAPGVGVAGDVIGREFLAKAIGHILLPLFGDGRHGLACEVVDGPEGNGTSDGKLVELFHLHLPRGVDAELGIAPDVRSPVCASKAEGGDAGQGRVHAGVDGLRVEEARKAGHCQVRVQLPAVGVRRAGTRHEHEDALQETGAPCAAFQVANVGLRASEAKGHFAGLHDIAKGAHLDGISEGSTCAMALRQIDHPRLEAGFAHRGLDAGLLRWPIGGRHASTAPILVDSAAQHHSGLLPIVLNIVAGLEVHKPDSLSACIAVAALVEGEAAAHWRDHVQATHGDVGAGPDLSAHTASHPLVNPARHVLGVGGQVALPHVHHRDASGHERGGASSVGSADGALHVEGVREPTASDRVVGAGEGAGVRPPQANVLASHVDLGLDHVHKGCPVRAGVADEDSDLGAVQGLAVVAAPKQHGVAILGEDPLGGVHVLRLCIGDVEELVVEVEDLLVAAEASVLGVGLAEDVRLPLLGAVDLGVPPQERDGNFPIGALEKHGPILFAAKATTWKTCLDAHDVHLVAFG
mmetsp:Transcript_114293/g.233766  ORF Transcript_114293/g.233766 Transcript_114293/m.233766 type:complete len:642 (+) Transcript_114293:851-2776(+)